MSAAMEDLPDGFVPTLEQLQTRHQAIARYRVMLCEGRGDRKRTQVDTNLDLVAARGECERLTTELNAAHPEDASSFARSIYLIELENPDDCLTPYARARLQLLAAAGRPARGARSSARQQR